MIPSPLCNIPLIISASPVFRNRLMLLNLTRWCTPYLPIA